MSPFLADVATRPPLRVRITANLTTPELDGAVVKRAHTNNLIERDASRPGDIFVGRRGAGPLGRRMRRECPNDRRPTRSASAGRYPCKCPGGRDIQLPERGARFRR